MTARTIMNPQPVTLHATDTVGVAVQYLLDHHLRHLPVVDAEGRYLGICGIYSLLRLVLPRAVTMEQGLNDVSFMPCQLPDLQHSLQAVAGKSVMECLQRDVPTVSPETSLLELVLLLLRAKVSLPVVDKESGRLVGMVSSWGALEKITNEVPR